MKRVQLSPLASQPLDESPLRVVDRKQDSRDEAAQAHRALTGYGPCRTSLFIPQNHEPAYAYPLIVWLHSNGDDAGQLLRVMPQISLRNFAAVAPQAATGSSAAGFHWEQNSSGIESAVRDIAYAIDYARLRLNVASHRVFVAGSGDGGTMAFRAAFRMSELVSGVVSINGGLPAGLQPFRQWPRCRKLQVLWAHSREAESLSEETLCSQLGLLHVAGFDVQLRQYPGADPCPPAALGDINRWAMEQIPTAIL